MNNAWLYSAPWQPMTAPLTTGSWCRTPELLDRVIDQFGLGRWPRWEKHVETRADGRKVVSTYCNVWLSDVTRALGCEVPRWWQRGALLVQLSANEQQRWLQQEGPMHGWSPCTVAEAQVRANLGHPAVATWLNPEAGHSGHVGLFVPDRGEEGLWISQAGLTCFSRGTLSSGFGPRNVLCFTHD